MSPEESVKIAASVIKEAYDAGGMLAALPLALVALVNLYRLDAVQSLLPMNLRWDSLGTARQTALAFAVSAAPVFATKVSSSSPGSAAILAISAACAAIFGHQFIAKPIAKSGHVVSAVAKMPGVAISAASIMIPLNKQKIEDIRAKAAADSSLNGED